MTFTTKLIVSVITIAGTIVSSIWGGFELLDMRMDRKVSQGEAKVLAMMKVVKDDALSTASSLKTESDLKVKGIDDKFMAEISGVKTQLVSMDSKLNLLIGIAQKKTYGLKQIERDEHSISQNYRTHKMIETKEQNL